MRYQTPAFHLLVVVLLALVPNPAHAEKKVILCPLPPGNPANPQTISVGEAAIGAHISHGDQLGECPRGPRLNASLCDEGNTCTSDACLAASASTVR